MRISSEDMNDLFVNRVDTFYIKDCIGMKFAADPKLKNTVGLMVEVKHEESGLKYKQLFFLDNKIAERMTQALTFHIRYDGDTNL